MEKKTESAEKKELEKIPLAVVYKQGGAINVDFSKDEGYQYELFGFFKCLVNKMENDLTQDLESKNEDDLRTRRNLKMTSSHQLKLGVSDKEA